MLLALVLAAALPAATPDPATVAQVDRWVAAADAATDPSDAAANLWRAADAADRRLRDYDRALALYDRLAREHPTARLARGAATRRDYVAKAVAGGAEPFRRFERVRAEFAKLPREAAREEVESILREHPEFPLADEAILWLGDRAAEEGEPAVARRWYRALVERFPESPLAAQAWAGLGRAAFAESDYAAAKEAFGKIAGTSVAGAELVSRKEIELVTRHEIRAGRVRVALAVLAAALIAAIATVDPRRLRAAVRASLGRELLYAGPVLVLLVLVAPSDGRLPVGAVAAAGIVFVWLAVLWAEASRPALARPGLRALSTAVGTIGGAAALYTVLYALDLLVAVERLLGEA